MKRPIYIRFSGMESSEALTTAADSFAHGLAWDASEIIACWVGIRREPVQGRPGGPYSVRVDVRVPGHELTAQRVQHHDVNLAMGHAFDDMQRQLQHIDPLDHHAEYAVTVPGQLTALEDTPKL